MVIENKLNSFLGKQSQKHYNPSHKSELLLYKIVFDDYFLIHSTLCNTNRQNLIPPCLTLRCPSFYIVIISSSVKYYFYLLYPSSCLWSKEETITRERAKTRSVLVFVPESSPDLNITRDEWVNAVMTWGRAARTAAPCFMTVSNEFNPWTINIPETRFLLLWFQRCVIVTK